jgi:MarR family transcriptional regulator for hemolysin
VNKRRVIGAKLVLIARQLRQRYDKRVQSAGVTGAKWTVIVAIARNPGATQRYVANELAITEVTAGRLVDRLCADGYLRRKADPADRRAYRIYLTKVATDLLGTLGAAADENEAEAFAGLKAEELKQLDLLLDTVAKNLDVKRNKADVRKSASGRKA